MQLRHRPVAAMAAIAALASLSCGDGATDPDPVSGLTVSVTGPTDVDLAGTAQLSARPRTLLGENVDTAVVWSSTGDSVAAVSPTGLVTGKMRGTATIIAEIPGAVAAGSLAVRVIPASVDLVFDSDAVVSVGDTVVATAVARDATGVAVMPFTAQFGVSDTSVVRMQISSQAIDVIRLSTESTGVVTISALIDGREGSAVLTVQ